MAARTVGGRVLWVGADDALRRSLPLDAEWQTRVAHSFEEARFLQQLDPSDVVILGGDEINRAALTILGLRNTAPVLFIADARPETVRDALIDGADAWLPRQAVVDHPGLLIAALGRLTTRATSAKRSRRLPRVSRRTSRLVSMLWETVPRADHVPWFSQRHMFDRLHEEIARSARHGGHFSMILGEIQTGGRTPRPAPARWTAWAARRISETKRRSDIVGQYGVSGFLLLLPFTEEEPAELVCRRLQTLLQNPPENKPGRLPRIELGLASYQKADTAIGMLCRAEMNLVGTPVKAVDGVPV